MNKEEFNKIWKDSTKEQILNQYYYDYEEMIKSHNIIKEIREEMENAKHISIDDFKAIIKHEKRILEILGSDKD